MSGYPTRMLDLAARLSRTRADQRAFFLGAIAERADGTIVGARNGPATEPQFRHHAEWRLSRKLDKGATVFIARTNKEGQWRNAKPCPSCMRRLIRCGVGRLIWTEGPGVYGTLCI